MNRLLYYFIFIFAASCAQAAPKIIVAFAGGSGSGKTTLANKLKEAFHDRSVIISQDSYYKEQGHLPIESRAKVNFDHPDSLDFDLLKQHLIALRNNEAIDVPVYNFSTHSRESGYQHVEPADLIIVEGILLFAVEELQDLFDLKFYVDTDEDVRLLRRIHRDMKERARTLDSICQQYLATVKPMHSHFVEPSKKKADMIIPSGGDNSAAVEMIVTKLEKVLSEKEPYWAARKN